MRWLRLCRHRAPDPPVSEEEAAAARERAEHDVAAAIRRDPLVRDVVRRLGAQGQQNHFGPVIWRALRGESDG